MQSSSEQDLSLPKSLLRFTPLGLSVLCVSLVALSAMLGRWSANHVHVAGAMSQVAVNASLAQGVSEPANTLEMPWGRLNIQDIDIEQPDEYVSFEATDKRVTRWIFKGSSESRVRELLQECGLSSELVNACLVPERKKIDVAELSIEPTDEAVLALSPAGRTKLYTMLSQWPENRYMAGPYHFERAKLASLLKSAQIPELARTQVAQLMYDRAEHSYFSDPELVLRGISDAAVRQRLMRVLTTQTAVIATLEVRPDSNIDALMGYWGKIPGVSSKDLRPLLESLQRNPQGGTVSLLHLLPRFARERLYTFPFPGQVGDAQKDCHWTALNFFSETPDDRLLDNAYASERVKQDFFPIGQPSQCGDLVFIVNEAGEVLHSAVYLAGDLCFTKNGVNFAQPWIIMHMSDLSNVYTVSSEPKMLYYRKK